MTNEKDWDARNFSVTHDQMKMSHTKQELSTKTLEDILQA